MNLRIKIIEKNAFWIFRNRDDTVEIKSKGILTEKLHLNLKLLIITQLFNPHEKDIKQTAHVLKFPVKCNRFECKNTASLFFYLVLFW